MKKIIALTLIAALSIGLGTMAFAANDSAESTAGISFYYEDDGIYPPGELPEIPGITVPEIDNPGGPKPPGVDEIEKMGSLDLLFGAHKVPNVTGTTTFVSSGPGAASGAEDSGVAIVAMGEQYKNGWSVTLSVGSFQDGTTATLNGFTLTMTPGTVVAYNGAQDVSSSVTAATFADATAGSSSTVLSSTGNALAGVQFAGSLSADNGSIVKSSPTAPLTWSLFGQQPVTSR